VCLIIASSVYETAPCFHLSQGKEEEEEEEEEEEGLFKADAVNEEDPERDRARRRRWYTRVCVRVCRLVPPCYVPEGGRRRRRRRRRNVY